MAQGKKFGTFGGVFTPAILTILGVIMYLRLPWIVGNGGLWTALGIIVVAHVVSVTTGLSVSSIATDKRVKAGGSYYIISRSLGLPIGGTLGLALFVGLSFSVSLYLIGFSESFLNAIDLGLVVDPATGRKTIDPTYIRVAGTASLIGVTLVTFISTALAIKTQYFIMTAIVLSLLSILLGGGGPPNLQATAPQLVPLAGGASAAVLFGIFFPAVTGFEAGVSMSGDLKDPRRSIPGGTLTAISVGLVVYLGLATWLAFEVDGRQLAENPDVLTQISLFPPLVLAGIWGATISSALGSILGAPRILQALSLDRIGPRLFARGHGPSNEPRNALLMTFVLAEAGILIGELDTIARIVSMFFMTTYGFLNLSCAIESWASTDFRPDFRIPRTVSVVGAATCFLLMIQLDFIAFVGATLLMGWLFVYLKRKELTLESGDTWEGVWSSVVRAGLDRLRRTRAHQRNWRPNVVLFSADDARRVGLAQLGEAVVQNRGVLSEFQLAQVETPDVRLEEVETPGPDPDQPRLHRRVETPDPWRTVLSVARFHGFGGLEPNTVLLDAHLLLRDPTRAGPALDTLRGMGHHVVLVANARERPAPSSPRIDVWWRGSGGNLALGMALARFLASSDAWWGARLRLLVATGDAAQRRSLEQWLVRWLEDTRLPAEVRVIHRARADEPFEDLVARESAEADVTLLGVPERDAAGGAGALAWALESLGEILRTVLLVRAAPSFESPLPEAEAALVAPVTLAASEAPLPEDAGDIALPDDLELAREVQAFHQGLRRVVRGFHAEGPAQVIASLGDLAADLEQAAQRAFDQLERAATVTHPARRKKALARVQSGYLHAVQRLYTAFQDDELPRHRDLVARALDPVEPLVADLAAERRATVEVAVTPADVRVGPDTPLLRRAGLAVSRRVARLTGRPVTRRLRVRERAIAVVRGPLMRSLADALERLGRDRYDALASLEALSDGARAAVDALTADVEARGAEAAPRCAEARADLEARLEAWRAAERQSDEAARAALEAAAREAARELAELQQDVLGRALPQGPEAPSRDADVAVFEEGLEHMARLVARTRLDLGLQALHQRLGILVQRVRGSLELTVRRGVMGELEKLAAGLEELDARLGEDAAARLSGLGRFDADVDDAHLIAGLLEDVDGAARELPETVDTYSEASFEALRQQQLDELQTVTIEARRLVAFVLETDLVGALQEPLARLRAAVRHAGDVARDVLRLCSFDASSGEPVEAEASLHDDRHEIVRRGRELVDEQREAVGAAWDEVSGAFDSLLREVVERTRVGTLTRSAGSLTRFIRTLDTERMLSRVGRATAGLKSAVERRLGRLPDREGLGAALARVLSPRHVAGTRVERLLALTRASSPPAAVQQALPIYYRQLFLGRSVADAAFWVPRDAELARAQDALDAHAEGHGGALLLTGWPGSGRTALAQVLAQRAASRERVVHVRPPEGGSVDVADFRRALRGAIGGRGDEGQLLDALPAGAVLVLHDLELWWERGPGGLAVIDHLEGLVDAWGEQHLFLMTVEEHAARLMGRLGRLDDRLLASVPCRPLSPRRLRDLVMRRHGSTGLDVRLEGPADRVPSELRMAWWFSALHRYAAGNPGAALAGWIAHIREVDERQVRLRRPRQLELEAFDALDASWVALLVELVLHRQMNANRLRRVTGLSAADLAAALAALKRSGLARETPGGAWELDRFTRHHTVRWLHERGLI